MKHHDREEDNLSQASKITGKEEAYALLNSMLASQRSDKEAVEAARVAKRAQIDRIVTEASQGLRVDASKEYRRPRRARGFRGLQY